MSTLIRALLASLVAVFILTNAYAEVSGSGTAIPVGKVVWVKGNFKAMNIDKTERVLTKASIIYLKDTLLTDANSQAQIVFTDNSLMTFRPNTRFFIDQYYYEVKKEAESVGKFVMNLIKGGFRTITGLIAKQNPTNYQVNTPVATIGVRGTDYEVYVEGQKVYVNSISGSPCMTGGGGGLCLSNKNPYGYVSSESPKPEAIKVKPAVFNEPLEVVPAKIEPFKTPTSTTSTSAEAEKPSAVTGETKTESVAGSETPQTESTEASSESATTGETPAANGESATDETTSPSLTGGTEPTDSTGTEPASTPTSDSSQPITSPSSTSTGAGICIQ